MITKRNGPSTALAGTVVCLSLCTVVSAALAAGTVEFRGHRYYITLGDMQGSLGIGFDPIQNHVLSVSETDVCGSLEVTRAGNSGVAWDPVGGEFWMINGNREVYRFDANDQPDVVFQIPETFDVPGAGSQTLHSPQGLAVDMQHVYVIDFGPNIGEADSGQWFKFTRSGTPVRSSALTDFSAALTQHASDFGDAPVDGIHWNPPTSVVDPGLFYVAVEHSGIVVLDADGMVVDNFLWSENGLTYGEHVPFAFAGLTVDPATGDLYLVENAGQQVHVWVRVPDDSPSVIHGVVSNWIFEPDGRCPRRGLFPTTLNFFSLTYRTVDGLLWTNEFNSGEVFTIDPLSRKATSLGFMGVNDVWGMAYDEERDVIYVFEEVPYTIHVLDPNTLQTTPLATDVPFVRELAFNSDDGFIYGVGGFPTANLYRFDRDSGEETIVGPTVNVAGIAYDPSTQTLVGHGSSALYDIEPATGLARVRSIPAAPGGWEGLAVIPTSPVPTAVTSPDAGVRSLVLQAFPNPISSQGMLSFELPRSTHVRATVYDLAGRRVASLHDGPMPAGRRTLHWNATDGRGLAVASGTYLVQLKTPSWQGAAKLLVTR